MNRRYFLQTSLVSSIALPAFALDNDNPYRKAIGIQLYTLRNQIKNDVKGTLGGVAKAGYKQVEAYGFDGTASDMILAAKDNGLKVNSTHFAWESVTNSGKKGVPDFDKILEGALKLGITHLVIPYLHARERNGLDGYKRVAENCNKAAIKAKTAGIQLAYHNHAFEFAPQDGGRTGFDVLKAEFASEMHFEVDVFWVRVGGVSPVKLLQELKGRVSQIHLKDLKKGMKLPNYGGVPKDAFQALGDGIIPMEPIIKAAGRIGVAHCHVEQDHSPDPVSSVKQSLQYLKSL
ncbi:MAG: sugar phosphate isomerase/epimerase [Opitutae bacterium]|nr:sugar phosphate isomerase/epimerase [Opitutae bacterium]